VQAQAGSQFGGHLIVLDEADGQVEGQGVRVADDRQAPVPSVGTVAAGAPNQVSGRTAAPAADVQANDGEARFRDTGSPLAYCQGMFVNPRGQQRVFADLALWKAGKTANAAQGKTLFDFMAARAHESFINLGCEGLLGFRNPITLTTNDAGVTTDATFTAGGARATTTTTSSSTITAPTTATTTTTTMAG
jgi:hypothetical protein